MTKSQFIILRHAKDARGRGISLILLASFLLLIPCLTTVQAKPETWTRIDSAKSDVSLAFPPGFLVDTERHGMIQFEVFAVRGGTWFHFRVEQDRDAKARLERVSPEGFSGERRSFDIGGLIGREFAGQWRDGRKGKLIYLASGGRFYTINVKWIANLGEDLGRFLYSIVIGGKRLYDTGKTIDFPEERIMFDKLATSNEVSDARSRKPDKQKVSVEIRKAAEYKAPSIAVTLAPAIIVDQPYPDIRQLFSSGFNTNKLTNMSAVVVVKLLANGQVGDIILYSDAPSGYIRACVEAARKTKFVPAKDGDKPVDSVEVLEYPVILRAQSSVTSIGPIIVGP